MIRDSLFFPFTPALRYFDSVTRISGKWNNALSKYSKSELINCSNRSRQLGISHGFKDST